MIMTTELLMEALRTVEAAEMQELGPVYLAPALYDAGVEAGADMRGYRRTELIPVLPSARKSVRTEYPACMPAHGGKCAICGTGDCLRRPS